MLDNKEMRKEERMTEEKIFPQDFEKIYSEYFPKIYNYFFYRLLSREDTEDLTADVFLKVAKNLDRFDRSKAQMKTWIYKIAQNSLVDFYRTRQRKASLCTQCADTEPAVDFEEQMEKILSVKRRALYRALSGLKERERMIVYYRFFEGYTNRRLARLFEMNESTVGTVLSRALKKMRSDELKEL